MSVMVVLVLIVGLLRQVTAGMSSLAMSNYREQKLLTSWSNIVTFLDLFLVS